MLQGLTEIAGVPVLVLRKPRQRNIYLRVRPGGEVAVSAACGCPDAAILDFVMRKLEWLLKTRERMRELPGREPAPPAALQDGDVLRLWGREAVLRIRRVAGSRSGCRLAGEEIVLSLPEGAAEEAAGAVLENFYGRALRERVRELLPAWEARMEVRVERLTIRRMSSRWGSLNAATRRLCLNSELARRAPECLELVLVHELCHFFGRGHTPGFYARLERLLPDWRERDRLLKGRGE